MNSKTTQSAAVLLLLACMAANPCLSKKTVATERQQATTQETADHTYHLLSGANSVLSDYTVSALSAPPKVEESSTVAVATAQAAAPTETEAAPVAEEAPKAPVPKREVSVPSYPGRKTWMSYRCITSKNSPQYKMQDKATTSPNGFRKYHNRYCVALGSYFGLKVGDNFDLVLQNGTIIPCVMADAKADQDTDPSHIFTRHSKCMSEFIIDSPYLNRNVKRSGDCSSIEGWDSPVAKVVMLV